MGKLIINNDRIKDRDFLIKTCPFGALYEENGIVSVNSACRMCGLCVKNSRSGEVVFAEDTVMQIDKSEWKGICVYVDHVAGEIHPVTYELINKARIMADKSGQKVFCLFIGSGISEKAEQLMHYPVDSIWVYDRTELEYYRTEPYTAVFEDFIRKVRPCIILVGATTVGRQLAPRVAARFRTGLTADCTSLDVEENTDLIQIRPAFGGNIMAQINTGNSRPQIATVRYKVMEAAEKSKSINGDIIRASISPDKLLSGIEVLCVSHKEKIKSIEAADIIVVAGRGIKNKQDLNLIRELAEELGGETASTRPLVEAGWMDPRRQIGLSGRTVRPKLIITCGVSGAVQFTAGMKASDTIIAINSDKNAPIFGIAHYGIVADLYELIPALLNNIRNSRGKQNEI